jgi:hypothetical protein
MDVTKTKKIRVRAMEVPKPYKFIGFGAMEWGPLVVLICFLLWASSASDVFSSSHRGGRPPSTGVTQKPQPRAHFMLAGSGAAMVVSIRR